MALSYQFPTLAVEQITSFCKEIDIPVTENDLRKPDVHRWNMLYGLLLEAMSGVSADEVRQSSAMCDYPELHQESTSLIAFTLALQRVMFGCAFTDFNMKDIIDPKPKRLIKIMSAAINFYRFRQSRIEVFEALKSKNERYREQREYLLKSNDEQKQKLSKLKAARAEQEPQIRKIQEDIDGMGQQMAENQRAQANQQKSISEIKKNIAEKKAIQDQLKLAIATSQQEGDKLSGKIVQSPERVRQEQEKMELKLSGLKMTLDARRTLGNKLENDHKKLKELEGCAEKALKLLQSIKQDVDKENEVVEQVGLCRDRQQELQQTLGELSAKQDLLKNALALRRERTTKIRMQHQTKMAAHTDQLAMLNEQVKCQTAGQDDEQLKLQIAKQQLLQELHDQEKKTETRIENIHQLYSMIVDLVDSNHVHLVAKWDTIRQMMMDAIKALADHDVEQLMHS